MHESPKAQATGCAEHKIHSVYNLQDAIAEDCKVWAEAFEGQVGSTRACLDPSHSLLFAHLKNEWRPPKNQCLKQVLKSFI